MVHGIDRRVRLAFSFELRNEILVSSKYNELSLDVDRGRSRTA